MNLRSWDWDWVDTIVVGHYGVIFLVILYELVK